MADIVPSLFGVTPQMYQRQQQDRMDAQALRFAQLDPFQQAQFSISRGANMLGGAIGGALGGQDPELQRITMRQQIAGSLDPSDLSTFQKAFAALAPTDPEGAMMVRAELEKVQMGQAKLASENALTTQRSAAAQASLAQATRERGPTGDVAKAMRAGEITRALQTPELNPLERAGLEAELSVLSPAKETKEPTTPDIINAAAFAASKGKPGTPEYTAAFQSKHTELISKAPSAAPSVGADREAIAQAAPFNRPYAQLTADEKAKVNELADQKALDRAKQTATKIVMPPQETEFEKGLGSGQSKGVLEDKAAALDAALILETNQVGRDLLKSGAITGTGADFFVAFNNALSQAGIDFGYADAAANSQAYAAAMGANVGRLIKQFGAGTGLSDADREFAEKMAGGKITLTKAALIRILDINDRAANRVIDRHNRNVKGIKTNIPLTVEKPTFNQPPPSAASQIPTTAAPARAAPASIPQAAIDALKAGRGTDAQFDQMFGPGAAKRVKGVK